MGYIDAADIRRLCAGVATFSRKADFTFTAQPTLTWEFTSRHNMEFARASLLQAINAEMRDYSVRGDSAALSFPLAEINCYGVLFRLRYKDHT